MKKNTDEEMTKMRKKNLYLTPNFFPTTFPFLAIFGDKFIFLSFLPPALNSTFFPTVFILLVLVYLFE